jgi:hypothetical protein
MSLSIPAFRQMVKRLIIPNVSPNVQQNIKTQTDRKRFVKSKRATPLSATARRLLPKSRSIGPEPRNRTRIKQSTFQPSSSAKILRTVSRRSKSPEGSGLSEKVYSSLYFSQDPQGIRRFPAFDPFQAPHRGW